MQLIPWPLPFCTAVHPVVFVPLGFAEWPLVVRQAVLAHEAIHHRQQRALGLAPFCWHYLLSPEFRWRIERRGYQRELWYLVRAGVRPNLRRYAEAVSGPLYAQMIDLAQAEAWLANQLAAFEHKG